MGREAARNGRFDTARRAFEAAADRGEAEGFYELGCLYWYGYGVERSQEKAAALFALAAEQNHASAQYQLALALWPRDRIESERWLVRAAEQEHAPAMTRLAEIFGDRDPPVARALLARAAAQGYAPAMIGFGHVLISGMGGRPDQVEGVGWLYAAAALSGDRDAEHDMRALARTMSGRDIAAAQKRGKDLVKQHRRTVPR